MSYFNGVRVGDKIWTIREGWTEVVALYENTACPIQTTFRTYTMDGISCYDAHQSAFWSDPGIVAPPRPKRLVKKMIKVRPFFDINNRLNFARVEEFNSWQNSAAFVEWCGPAQFIEVEVWE